MVTHTAQLRGSFLVPLLGLALALGACDDSGEAEPDGDTAAGGSGGEAAGGSTGGGDAGGAPGAGGDAAGGAAGGAGGAGAGGEAAGGMSPPTGLTYAECFPEFVELGIDYDQFDVVCQAHCNGTNHQTIDGVEKVVFLGDSITAGAPGTPPNRQYKALLTDMLEARFGDIEIGDCSRGGATTRDFLSGGRQIPSCFPDVEDKKTLVVFTMGGNDFFPLAVQQANRETAMRAVDGIVERMEEAVAFFSDESKFPNGVYVVYSNVYEFTGATADLSVCPVAGLAGFAVNWPLGIEIFARLDTEYTRIAVEHQRDVVFMEERFCSHGFVTTNPESPCYTGMPEQTWFNGDCIHPNTAGHRQLANFFYSVITDETPEE